VPGPDAVPEPADPQPAERIEQLRAVRGIHPRVDAQQAEPGAVSAIARSLIVHLRRGGFDVQPGTWLGRCAVARRLDRWSNLRQLRPESGSQGIGDLLAYP